MSLSVERSDGDFEDGHKSIFFLHVRTAPDAEPVTLRPYFFDIQELNAWVDKVFPGASFGLLPPKVLTATQSSPARPLGDGPWGTGTGVSGAIRVIGDGMASGNEYEPPHGPPPPGGPVAG